MRLHARRPRLEDLGWPSALVGGPSDECPASSRTSLSEPPAAKLTANEIDTLYVERERVLAGRFLHQVNVALKAYLAVAGPSAKPEPCSTKAKTLSIVGAIEPTKEYGRRTGRPRRREGVRTITIDHALIDAEEGA
jgi:hypothetical protein